MRASTRPWVQIAAFYRDTAAWLAPMGDLAERIAASPYASGVHAFTSMHTLIVGQAQELEWNDHVLRIDPIVDGGGIARIRFEYVEYPGADRRWTRECAPADAFATFERFLRAQRWFVTLPPPA